MTVRNALSVLQGEGLVHSEHGKGVFVRPPESFLVNVTVPESGIARGWWAALRWHWRDWWPAPGNPFWAGSSATARNFNREFAARADKAGVRRIRPHDTRHTCGSLLATLDVRPRVAMQILRHSEIAVTMEVYTHVPPEETRKVLRKLGRHLGEGTGT